MAIKNPTVEAVEEYIGARTPILHRCIIHDVVWSVIPYSVLKGHGCKMCGVDKRDSILRRTQEEYIQQLMQKAPNIELVGNYVNATTPVSHYCKKHDVTWDATPDNILSGHGCKQCGNEKMSIRFTKPREQYIEELKSINPSIMCIGEYVNMNTNVMHRCLVCGNEWETKPQLIKIGSGCPQCSESHGERLVRQYLESHSIKYVFQKKFDECRNVHPLPFDFYLPEYNSIIEYDGEQHFRPIEWFGGDEGFNNLLKRDEIKNEYCKENNIPILRIPYYADVTKELDNFLFA